MSEDLWNRSMTDKFDELENEIDNVMSDEQVRQVRSLIDDLREEYAGPTSSDIPAFNHIGNGEEAVVENALQEGVVQDIAVTRDIHSGHSEVNVTISMPDEVAKEEYLNYR